MDFLLSTLKGILIGAGAILPGISSGVLCVIFGEQGGFIIKHGVGHLRAGGEVDVPLSYGDYYYIEALLRYKKLLAQAGK